MRAVVIGLAPQPGGVALRFLDHGEMQRSKFFAARFEGRLAAGIDLALDRFGEHGQRGFAVAGDVEINILEAAEILIIRFQIKIADTERDHLGARLGERARPPNNAVAEGGYRSP
jgi:hypothetical protein